jgi:hypothetical protein
LGDGAAGIAAKSIRLHDRPTLAHREGVFTVPVQARIQGTASTDPIGSAAFINAQVELEIERVWRWDRRAAALLDQQPGRLELPDWLTWWLIALTPAAARNDQDR